MWQRLTPPPLPLGAKLYRLEKIMQKIAKDNPHLIEAWGEHQIAEFVEYGDLRDMGDGYYQARNKQAYQYIMEDF